VVILDPAILKAEIASSPARFFGLDSLRALAITVVMLYHLTIFGELPWRIFPVAGFGWMGVDLFFVLSGFLIGQQVLKPYLSGQQLSIADFYKRRAFRILPSYLAVLLLYFLVPGWREFPNLAPLWKFMTFTMNFGFRHDQRAFSHAWSLCVEEHFYLALPLLVTLLMRRSSVRKTVVCIAFIVLSGIVLRAFLVTHYPDKVMTLIYYPSVTRLDGLLVGVGLAILRAFRPTWWNTLMNRGHMLLIAGVACISCVVWMFRDNRLGDSTGSGKWGLIFGLPLLSLGLGLVVASSVSKNGLLARVRIPGAEFIATLAFSLYLTHKAVAHVINVHLPEITSAQGPESWLLYCIGCFSVALLLHVAVERPFLRLRDRLSRQKPISVLEEELREEPGL
jgi:peptidoglycan/LPS O-acetylase OafA/YrhL